MNHAVQCYIQQKSLTAANEHIRVGGKVFHIDATGSIYTQLVKKW